mmetsp:Transcript_33429/g.60400  ORF Transcript_33429/g.60400 Transcript_33429/m.60400 type:complete len:251 (-) Transcript_33429:391-1143(-)
MECERPAKCATDALPVNSYGMDVGFKAIHHVCAKAAGEGGGGMNIQALIPAAAAAACADASCMTNMPLPEGPLHPSAKVALRLRNTSGCCCCWLLLPFVLFGFFKCKAPESLFFFFFFFSFSFSFSVWPPSFSPFPPSPSPSKTDSGSFERCRCLLDPNPQATLIASTIWSAASFIKGKVAQGLMGYPKSRSIRIALNSNAMGGLDEAAPCRSRRLHATAKALSSIRNMVSNFWCNSWLCSYWMYRSMYR